MKLYEIEQELDQLFWKADHEEITEEELHAAITNLQMQAELKLGNLGRCVRNIQAEAAVLKIEEDRLKHKRQTLENRIEGITAYVDGFLSGQEYKDPLIRWCYQKCPPSVNVLDETLIPLPFWKPQDPKLDKAGILQSLKEGAEIPGVTLVKDKKTLRLK